MATIGRFNRSEVKKENQLFSRFKTLVETAFYGNNVTSVTNLQKAYHLATQASGTVVTDLPVKHTSDLGLPEETKMLIFNDGKIVGRTAAARVVIGHPGVDSDYYQGILREALYQSREQNFYTADVVVGLDEKFMVKSHLMLPEGFENNLYSYLLNFQIANKQWQERYENSVSYEENDIYLFANPNWQHPDFPFGLALFDPEHNVAAVLGLRYFGELKKGTLTLAWATAHRNNYVACHGGIKQYQLPEGNKYTMAAFGLSGSGKSTITLTQHGGKYKVDVLHDDAFIIDRDTGSTIALEPAYFDKVQDYPLTHNTVDYYLTMQNVGATKDKEGKTVPVLQDIRNGNGRTVKSRYVTKNRVDALDEKLDAVFWIMKDDSLPPVVKVEDPILAAVFGLTLATKRSTAENVVGDVDLNQLVIEPYADPFRAYPLAEDYRNFRDLFNKNKTACYILNTDAFHGKDITPQVTLSSIEKIITGEAIFEQFGPIKEMSYLPIEGYELDLNDKKYMKDIHARLQSRLDFILKENNTNEGYDALPEETAEMMRHVISEL
ncbi:phosphoenolpyruvate carboxykinase (ATP) [Tetragenococcus halophilus]|uniref:phosphoenolpyruvate carboxykinase (ATP) n=1 Tax=Tetragenococcus halophilus TaxID=51669 RepID=A0A3G5FLZ6_TETHA|nr:phosphoenolpyruvate carboxykinase (ATP) [Tetragenococcus halophilus]AYW51357.1 phosphoenolpyruvate carboxykinase (ATP) [Tetragenococcus halophilus]MCF1601679.1 phosphoenolpyruvate carboxykinase (ATP) [Tetragenococcus halophilus]MCO8285163.1 phosphoenolpyruvate carboxykinase (ATP) [Tetragenococcus halophilus]MCO8288752.1 phosphoenolpyruvate carboxykinase (ATP) [Tetragenococcus halophilus]MCO8291189.1 phosphoenolpyruvate carboxykinase (ATP) [Tetragenococcus halophilus]